MCSLPAVAVGAPSSSWLHDDPFLVDVADGDAAGVVGVMVALDLLVGGVVVLVDVA